MQNTSPQTIPDQDVESAYLASLESDPSNHEIYYAYALYQFQKNNLEKAYQLLSQALRLNPSNGLYHRNLGEIARRIGNIEQAILCGEAACKISPKDSGAFFNLGIAYADHGELKKAIATYRKGLRVDKKNDFLWNNLGAALELDGDKEGALRAYDAATKIKSANAQAQNNKGVILSELGRIDEARESFAHAIDADPNFPEAHYNFSSLKTYTNDDKDLYALETIFNQKSQLSTNSRIRFCFAYGKALEDVGRYHEAFNAYNEGNQLEYGQINYEESKADELVDNIIHFFSKEYLEKNRKIPSQYEINRSPIFIVGMPRSGTSLLEQVLDSHPSVYGAGEIAALQESIMKSCKLSQDSSDGHLVDRLKNLPQHEVHEIGKNYINSVWKSAPKSHFITDKMPANFFYIGLIYIALPQAKIIHTIRDPMDSGFSIFSRYFNTTMGFAYNQETIGRYYQRYMRLMNHWRNVLPENYIFDLQYEEMVTNFDQEVKRVLEYINLPWDDRCLQFHKNTRTVKTASIAQVRKPIYQSSVARWKKFAHHLRPLYEQVKQFRDPNDVPDFTPIAIPVNSKEVQALLEQSLALQAKNEHEKVAQLVEPFLFDFGKDIESAPLWHLLGISHYRLDQFTKACACYQTAINLAPNFANAFNSLGFALQDIGEFKGAEEAFSAALHIAPEMAMARLNLGMLQLKMGNFADGMENYESRWIGSAEGIQGTFMRPQLPLPQWNGEENTINASLLVFAEQGFGDTFQYTRYLLLAKQRFRKVGFVCSEPTARILDWSMGNDILILTHFPRDYVTWDWQCPLMSLPRAFKTRLETIPASLPYYKTSQLAEQHWRERLNLAAPQRFKVGIAWAGRKAHQYDQRRSLDFNQLSPLFENKGISWVSLQKWAPEEAQPAIPQDLHWIDWTNELHDFADTAALIANLDLIISIDSSMIHLAGALNKPTWMLNRFDSEWRWFAFQSQSPWYPNLRVFNQATFGNWASVMSSVKDALSELNIPNMALNVSAIPAVNNPHELALSQNIAPQELSVDQAITLANQLQSSGRLKEAESVLHQLLSLDPKNAHALHLLGIVSHQSKHPALAIQFIEQAIEISPGVAIFHSNLMEMLRQAGDLQKAVEHGQIAIAIDPSMATAYSNLGVALYDLADYERSSENHLKAISINPKLLQSLNNLGSIARANQNKANAIKYYQQALDIEPNFVESLINMGAVLVEEERATEAMPILNKALEIDPNSPTALCNLGLANLSLEKLQFAKNLLQASLKIDPNYYEALIGLARVHHETKETEAAIEILKKALVLNEKHADAWCALGTIYAENFRNEEAQDCFNSVLKISPNNPDALTGLATLLLENGKINASIDMLNSVLDANSLHIGANFHLSQTQKITVNCANLHNLERLLPTIDSLSRKKQISTHYALGKAYDDLGKFDQAFHHFVLGAKIKRSTFQFNSAENTQLVKNIIQTCTPKWFSKNQGVGNSSNVPVFVLGMPRSGTTLTEQIIASHPKTFGAGELDLLLPIAQSNVKLLDHPFPANLEMLTTNILTGWGDQYVNRLLAYNPKALRITDKMPINYMALGLIPLILPNAKIIHVQRNPIDTCFSCFTRLFHSGQDATYDLVEMGKRFNDYALLMEHWRTVLPKNSFMEIDYESIVSDLDTQARKLVDWCDLDWNSACLDFYKNQRKIHTASVLQVREPIYQSSVARWKNYEAHLAPLINELRKGPLAHKL
jgi:tetratricopeptide (TPR) repeat protein